MIVRIRASPVSGMAHARRGQGWLAALLGPVHTMLKVRTSSQVDRNRAQLDAMIAEWEDRDAAGVAGFPILNVVLELQREATLSWYLTEAQKEVIEEDLDDKLNQPEFARIERFLRGDFGAAGAAKASR